MIIFPYNNFYFNNIVSLLSVGVFISFLMRMVMLHEIKFFVANKKFIEETKLRYKELSDLAGQVAHDIRSPLSAIMILAKDNPNIPEDSRVLFRTGVTRILDITNELLNKSRGFLDSTKQDQVVETEKSSVQLITNILESIVSEKRVEFRSKLNVQIQTNFNSSSFGMFANIQKSELKRILSNLINNSVDAVKEKGRIEVNASLVSDTVVISVQDNGIGISQEVLPKLLKRGATFNKDKNNLGVGLYHAYTKITGWGGNITIASELNKGTKVTLTLPACVLPKWFAKEIEIGPYSKIVVLDDDLAIHQVWDKRFEEILEEEPGIEIVHLSTVDQFDLWIKNNNDADVLFLIDYELLGQTKNGIEVIQSYGLQEDAILVTSRSEEQGLIDRCLSLGIKILPKVSADIVPIVLIGQGIVYTQETHLSDFDPKMVH
jgi:nitrogen-specific signal transduction histidine kinase